MFLFLKGCGIVINNTLTNPRYPNNCPSYVHCVYKVPISQGKVLKIDFQYFHLVDDASCR